MSKIFENGYLKPDVINPNYRGIVGWPFCDLENMAVEHKLLGISVHYCLVEDGVGKCFEDEDVRDSMMIKQFTPKDIPVGELCWVNNEDGFWLLAPHFEIDFREEEGVFTCDEFCNQFFEFVPYLIAETAERAEELKDWWK